MERQVLRQHNNRCAQHKELLSQPNNSCRLSNNRNSNNNSQHHLSLNLRSSKNPIPPLQIPRWSPQRVKAKLGLLPRTPPESLRLSMRRRQRQRPPLLLRLEDRPGRSVIRLP